MTTYSRCNTWSIALTIALFSTTADLQPASAQQLAPKPHRFKWLEGPWKAESEQFASFWIDDPNRTVVIKGNKFTAMSASTGNILVEGTIDATLTTINITSKRRHRGHHVMRGIYRMDKDTLEICLESASGQRPAEFPPAPAKPGLERLRQEKERAKTSPGFWYLKLVRVREKPRAGIVLPNGVEWFKLSPQVKRQLREGRDLQQHPHLIKLTQQLKKQPQSSSKKVEISENSVQSINWEEILRENP